MAKLSSAQLELVAQHLQQAKPHPALQAELVDHMAILIEQQMDQGQDFQTAFNHLISHASPKVMQQLKHHYEGELVGPRIGATLRQRRTRRRPATPPFRYIFLSCGLTLLILMAGLVVVSRLLTIPLEFSHAVWPIGLAGLGAVGLSQWWLKRRTAKVTPLTNT